MATRNRSGRDTSGTRQGNQTPNTPDVKESEIAALKVDQLRDRLRRRGITDTSDMKKKDLVQALVKAMRDGNKTTRSRRGGRGGSGTDVGDPGELAAAAEAAAAVPALPSAERLAVESTPTTPPVAPVVEPDGVAAVAPLPVQGVADDRQRA